MADLVTFTTNADAFSDWVKQYADAALITLEAAFEAQGRALCDRLMKFTPPLAGKSIKRGLWARDIAGMRSYKADLMDRSGGDVKAAFAQFSPFHDPEIEDMSAKAIGERRVELDIRKVIKGVKGATMPPPAQHARVFVSQNATHSQEQLDWAIRQRCQGRDAFRIYADRHGNVYGVDSEHFLPHATITDLKKIHADHRGKRGRVTTAGAGDVVIGRWRWLNIAVVNESIAEEFIELQKKNVGQARGGWAAAYVAFGGKISVKGWVGRHMEAGTIRGWPPTQKGIINVSFTNNSAWASNRDPDRVVENAIGGRERDIEKAIEIILEKRWGKGAGEAIH